MAKIFRSKKQDNGTVSNVKNTKVVEGTPLTGNQVIKAYCTKCKEKGVKITNAMLIPMNNGGQRVGGIHKVCGTKVTVIVGKEVKA